MATIVAIEIIRGRLCGSLCCVNDEKTKSTSSEDLGIKTHGSNSSIINTITFLDPIYIQGITIKLLRFWSGNQPGSESSANHWSVSNGRRNGRWSSVHYQTAQPFLTDHFKLICWNNILTYENLVEIEICLVSHQTHNRKAWICQPAVCVVVLRFLPDKNHYL